MDLAARQIRINQTSESKNNIEKWWGFWKPRHNFHRRGGGQSQLLLMFALGFWLIPQTLWFFHGVSRNPSHFYVNFHHQKVIDFPMFSDPEPVGKAPWYGPTYRDEVSRGDLDWKRISFVLEARIGIHNAACQSLYIDSKKYQCILLVHFWFFCRHKANRWVITGSSPGCCQECTPRNLGRQVQLMARRSKNRSNALCHWQNSETWVGFWHFFVWQILPLEWNNKIHNCLKTWYSILKDVVCT